MKLSEAAQEIALEIWEEQIQAGIGEPGEVATQAGLDDWLGNRTYPGAVLEKAAKGDAQAIVRARTEAGISIF
jgi:hypothetical protein